MNSLCSRANPLKRIFVIKNFLFGSSQHRTLSHRQIHSFCSNLKDLKLDETQDRNKSKDRSFVKQQIKHSHSSIPQAKNFDDEESRSVVQRKPRQQSRQIEDFFNLDQEGKIIAIERLKQKQKVKQLSLIAKRLLFDAEKFKSDIIWCALQQAFISLLQPTKDQNRIRSLSQFLYSMGKSKRATHNYETQMALLLPFSSHQSFTQIVTTISRMGGMSEEFSHIVEKLYWKRREELTPLETNLVNYVLAKNGKKIDAQLIEIIENFPLRSIVLMLRAYDMSGMMTSGVLKKCIPMIISRKQETNFLDFRGIFNIYCKHLYLDDKEFIGYLLEQYKILARNVNEQALEQIWEYFPQAANSNKLPIAIVEEIIKSLKILRLRNRMGERTWKKIKLTFGDFQNLQIRTQLQKI